MNRSVQDDDEDRMSVQRRRGVDVGLQSSLGDGNPLRLTATTED
jgi:hypothetical protein